MTPAKPDRWWLIPAVFCGLSVLPTAFNRFPPMSDVAAHLQTVSLLINHEKPEFLPGLYQMNWGHPNQLFHFICMCLAYVIGPEPAVKLVTSLTLFAIMMGVARLIHHRHGDTMLALASATITAGFLYIWGLVTNLLGVAILIWIFPWLDEYGRKPNFRSGLKFALGGVLVYFGHELTFILLVGASALWAVLFWSTPRRFLLQMIFLPLGYAMHVWEIYYHTARTPSLNTYWSSMEYRILHVVEFIWTGTSFAVDIGLVLLTFVLTIPLIRWRRVRSIRRWLLVRRHLVFAASCLVLFFVMPAGVRGATLINQRFVPIGWLFMLVGAAPRLGKARGWQRLSWATVPFVSMVVMSPRHLASYELMTDFDKLIPLMEKGASVITVDADRNDQVHPDAYFDADNYVASIHGGRSGGTFTESPIAPIWIPEDKQWNGPFSRVYYFGGGMKPASDFKFFRYVLLRTIDQKKALALVKAMKPEGRFVAHLDAWTLLESTLTVVPPDTQMDQKWPGEGLTLFQRVMCVGKEGRTKEWLQSDKTWKDMPNCQIAPGIMLQPLEDQEKSDLKFDFGFEPAPGAPK